MLKEEISELPELKEAGIALTQFAASQFSGTKFTPTSQGRHVANPNNFVTFKVQSARAKSIRVTLRGNPSELLIHPELPLKADMGGYSTFAFTEVNQLAAAASYIRRAAEIFQKGRERVQKSPRVIED